MQYFGHIILYNSVILLAFGNSWSDSFLMCSPLLACDTLKVVTLVVFSSLCLWGEEVWSGGSVLCMAWLSDHTPTASTPNLVSAVLSFPDWSVCPNATWAFPPSYKYPTLIGLKAPSSRFPTLAQGAITYPLTEPEAPQQLNATHLFPLHMSPQHPPLPTCSGSFIPRLLQAHSPRRSLLGYSKQSWPGFQLGPCLPWTIPYFVARIIFLKCKFALINLHLKVLQRLSTAFVIKFNIPGSLRSGLASPSLISNTHHLNVRGN